MERVGMIGAGAMGLALLEQLQLAGVHATVYDSDPPASARAGALGCEIASSAAEVARKTTLIDVVVRTDEDVLGCMTGAGGVLENAAAGTLVLLHSTILPQTVTKVAAAARERSIDVMDACMSGVPDTVRAGNLCFLVGGSKDLLGRAEPHLRKMGKQVFHMGPVGAGAVAKLVKNLVTGAETLIIHESIQIALAGGIPYPDALEMLRQTGHDSVLNRWQKTFDRAGKNPLPRSGRNVMNKDIPLACELARLYDLDLPITAELGAAALRVVKANEPR